MIETTNGRIPHEALNGAAKPARKSKAASAPKPSAKARMQAQAAQKAQKWAHAYTAAAVVLSSGLNAYAAVHESGADGLKAVAAGVIGGVVPLLVWVLGTVTAWTYRAGWRRLASVSGAVACCVLALSVIHVAAALALLTGSTWVMSGLLAVGIDCGLVSSEATAVLVSSAD